MSKKKETNKTKGSASKQNSKKTALIIAAAAVVLAAVVLLAVFVIAPWIEGRTNVDPKPPVTHEMNTVAAQEGEKYEYVEYRGLRMPRQVAEILNQAEIDNAEACKNYGIAMNIGSNQISRPRFEMYYNYAYVEKVRECFYQLQSGQAGSTGFDINVAPEKQRYPFGQSEDYTWANRFTDNAVSNMQYYFAAFECAVDSKLQLTEEDFQRMIFEYEDIESSAESHAQTVDEYIKERVGENVTYPMYAAHIIMSFYATLSEENEIEKYKQAVTQKQLEDFYNEKKENLRVAKVRIYPIEAETYNEADINKIKTEADFLEYAEKTAIYSNYDAAASTEYWWIDCASISDAFGPAIGEWIFYNEHKKGDIALVQGTIFPCLIYIDTPAFEIATHQVIICEYTNSYDADETMIEQNKGYADELRNYFVDSGSTLEAANTLVKEGYGVEKAVSIQDYGTEIDKWVFDSARKAGDYARIDNADGSYFIYYLHENPEDYEWMRSARLAMALEAYDNAFTERVEKDFVYKVVSRNSIVDAWNHSYAIMKPYIQERKDIYGIK